MENIRVTDEAFRDMRGTSIQYYPQKGIMTALDFELTDVVTVFAMQLIATVLVRAERDNGLLALVRSTPAGRLHTAGAKLLVLHQGDRVGLAVLHDFVGEQQVLNLRGCRLLIRHRLQIRLTLDAQVLLLHQDTIQ